MTDPDRRRAARRARSSLKNLDTGAARELTTNEVGFYSAPFLAVGRYSVTAKLTGFGTVVRDDVDVGLEPDAGRRLSAEAATVAETVTVVGAAPPINTTNAEVKGTLTAAADHGQADAQPRQLPVAGRDLRRLSGEPDVSGQNNPTASSGSSINFNGTGTRGATFQINGVNNDDSSENQNRQGAALSTIKEFQVITNTYSAEFGRGYGAVVLVQTKSGTNQWRGDVYEFMQDSNDLTALREVRARSSRTTSGTSSAAPSGFPIRQNRLFGFASFDRTKLEGTQNYARDILLPNELHAAADARQRHAGEPRVDRVDHRAISRAARRRTTRAARGPTRRSSASTGPPRTTRAASTGSSARTALTGRYQYTHQIFETDDVIVGEQARQDNTQQNLGFTWTQVVLATTWSASSATASACATRTSTSPPATTRRSSGSRRSPVSGTIIGNAGTFPDPARSDRQPVRLQPVLALRPAITRSRPAPTSGAQQLDDFADSNSRGFWTFDRVCGGVTYATAYDAFLDGCVATFTKAWGPFFLENRINESNFYAEDNWRVRPDLTLNLGSPLRVRLGAAGEGRAHRLRHSAPTPTTTSRGWARPGRCRRPTGWLEAG